MDYEFEQTFGVKQSELVLKVYKEQGVYQHIVSWNSSKAWVVSLISHDLITPTLTDLHIQDDLLFFSGNSGEGYWSMCVQGGEHDPGVGRIRFDIACRAKKPFSAEEIGSAYVRSQGSDERYELQADFKSPTASVERGGGEIRIYPEIPATPVPYTLSYQYELFRTER